MKLFNRRRFTFIVKSFMWSALLYVAMMITFNWDEVHNSVTGKNPITVISTTLPESMIPGTINPAPSSGTSMQHGVVVKSIIAAFRVIIGISGHSATH